MLSIVMYACASQDQVATSSFVQTLPPLGSRLAIWSEDAIAEETARRWIGERGLKPVQKEFSGSSIDLNSLCVDICDARAVTKAIKKQKNKEEVDYILIIRVESGNDPDRLAVRVNGISLASSSEDFRGRGIELLELMDESSRQDKAHVLTNLVCKTLSTVWRYRPAGFVENESVDYCHLAHLRADL